MGDRYWIQIECGGCGAKNPSDEKYEEDLMENGVYYAPSSGFMHFTCEKCGKANWIETFRVGKVVSADELKKLYEKEGFVEFNPPTNE